MTTAKRPQVMIMSTHHMDNPNLDYVKTSYPDIFQPTHQERIKKLVDRLTQFAPTHVALEFTPEHMPAVNRQYRQYLTDEDTLTRNEIDQIGYRLARACGHEQVYGIDCKRDLDMNGLMAYAQDKGMFDLLEEVQRFLAEMKAVEDPILQNGSVVDFLRYLNEPEYDRWHGIYLRTLPVGAGDNYIGANFTADWYVRNLMMMANVAKLAHTPDDRVFVLVGAAHGTIMREFARQSPQLELVDVLPYLV